MMEQNPLSGVGAAAVPPSGRLPGRQLVGIGAVERDTGLTKDTLRVWERRYDFPKPERDAFGERAYPREQVEKLRVIKRLMDAGFRPGKIMARELDELRALMPHADAGGNRTEVPAALVPLVDLVRAHRVDDLRRSLGQEVARGGLGRFITTVAAPLGAAIGELWMRGEIEVFEEHLYTESLQVVLRGAIANVPQAQVAPRVLMTTLPNEQHGLGLLMAEGMLVLEGARCISLGIETPVLDIVPAARSQEADIVALSFSQAYPVVQAVDALAELRRALPAGVDIWAGGGTPLLQRRLPEGVQGVGSLAQVQEAVALWRARHPGSVSAYPG